MASDDDQSEVGDVEEVAQEYDNENNAVVETEEWTKELPGYHDGDRGAATLYWDTGAALVVPQARRQRLYRKEVKYLVMDHDVFASSPFLSPLYLFYDWSVIPKFFWCFYTFLDLSFLLVGSL